jgi:hypothetical protein
VAVPWHLGFRGMVASVTNAPQTNPRATRALWFGIVGLAGSFLALPLVLGPFGWVAGARARNEIAASPHLWTGSGEATAGLVLGIINTVLLVLTAIVVMGFVVLVLIFGLAASGPGY